MSANENKTDKTKRLTCRKCGDAFEPHWGEHSRCPDCLEDELGDAESATGVE